MSRASGHYRESEEGRRYAAWQLRVSRGSGAIVARQHFAREIRPSERVLDFGCGGGGVISALACSARFGVEPNPVSRDVAIEAGVDCRAGLEDFASESVDVVISNHALEHCLDPLHELREMRRVLVPRGRLLLVLPIDDWRTQRRWRPDDINHHLFGWNPLLIGNLLVEAGFRPNRIEIVNRAWPPRVTVAYRLLPWFAFQTLLRVWSLLANQREMRAFSQRATDEGG